MAYSRGSTQKEIPNPLRDRRTRQRDFVNIRPTNAQLRRLRREVASVTSRAARASSAQSTGILQRFCVYSGPRTACAGFVLVILLNLLPEDSCKKGDTTQAVLVYPKDSLQTILGIGGSAS